MDVVEEAKKQMAKWGTSLRPSNEANDASDASMSNVDHERERYLARLRSYKASRWSAWKPDARPTSCAKHGWTCVGVNLLRCDDCAATIRDVGDGELAAKRMVLAHASTCRWKKRGVESTSPPGPLAGREADALARWNSRVEGLLQLPWLPPLRVPTSYDTQERQVEERKEKAHALSTFGWCVRHLRRSVVSNGSPKVRPRVLESCEGDPPTPSFTSTTTTASWTFYCRVCGAEVGAWRLTNPGQGNEREKTPAPSARTRRRANQLTIAGGQLGASVGNATPEKAMDHANLAPVGAEVLDVVGAHRYYCEWIQGIPNEEKCGWQVLAEKVNKCRDRKGLHGICGGDAVQEVIGKRKREADPEESLARVKRVLSGRRH
mmetsp:Transcript_584/g.2127  ORF Transcript_584/g.2127 Transcript_584/m.2127 type:complete len:377 (+) Transcript_584:367-1497(+)